MLVQRATVIAQDIFRDPFAIRRPLTATPEALTPVFQPFELKREELVAKSIIGIGQV